MVEALRRAIVIGMVGVLAVIAAGSTTWLEAARFEQLRSPTADIRTGQPSPPAAVQAGAGATPGAGSSHTGPGPGGSSARGASAGGVSPHDLTAGESAAPPGPTAPWRPEDADDGPPAPFTAPEPLPTPNLTSSATVPARDAAPLVTHGSRGSQRIAITVDDAHSPAAVEAILAVFLEQRVNATWFPVGSAALLRRELWHRIAGLGFEIGNHTWSHSNLTRLTDAGIDWEIVRGRSALRQATGRPVAPFLRPPGGAWDAGVLAAAGRTGHASVVNWDTTSGDTGRGSADQVVRNATRGQYGSILLFHANDPESRLRTAQALPRVIEHYREQGYELVTLGQLLGVAGPVPFPGS